jgi:hypothetical protein
LIITSGRAASIRRIGVSSSKGTTRIDVGQARQHHGAGFQVVHRSALALELAHRGSLN